MSLVPQIRGPKRPILGVPTPKSGDLDPRNPEIRDLDPQNLGSRPLGDPNFDPFGGQNGSTFGHLRDPKSTVLRLNPGRRGQIWGPRCPHRGHHIRGVSIYTFARAREPTWFGFNSANSTRRSSTVGQNRQFAHPEGMESPKSEAFETH